MQYHKSLSHKGKAFGILQEKNPDPFTDDMERRTAYTMPHFSCHDGSRIRITGFKKTPHPDGSGCLEPI